MADKQADANAWDRAPKTELIPYLDEDEKRDLVANGTTLMLTGISVDMHGQYGPTVRALVLLPTGDARIFTMKWANRTTPRDEVNEWLATLLKKAGYTSVPVKIVKRGNAFMFDRPDNDGEGDYTGTGEPVKEEEVPF